MRRRCPRSTSFAPQADAPAQQGWFRPPHAVQLLPEQTWLVPPHASPLAMHLPDTASQHPEAQVLPAQQIWPGLPGVPHATQALPVLQISVWPPLFEQAAALATHLPETGSQQSEPRQVLPAQHAWVVAPQTVQDPPVQTLPPVQDAPVETHWEVYGSQQPPLAQVLPAQQACPLPPQVTHWLPLHSSAGDRARRAAAEAGAGRRVAAPRAQAGVVAQQACVLLPHAVHWPAVQIWLPLHAPPVVTHIPLVPSQQPPDAHVLPEQHTLPEAPHATQLLPWQIWPVPHVAPLETHCEVVVSQHPVVHVLPAQHASPGLPHTLASTTSSGASVGASDAASPPSWARSRPGCSGRARESAIMPSGVVPSDIVLSGRLPLSKGVVPSPVAGPSLPPSSPEVASAGPVGEDRVVVGASCQAERQQHGERRERKQRKALLHRSPRRPMKPGVSTSDVLAAWGDAAVLPPPKLRAKSVAPAATPTMPTPRPTLATSSWVLPLETSPDLLGGHTLPGHALCSPL